MALLDDLIAYWSLDQASGTRFDSHGSNDLTDNNTVGSAAGQIATAADLEDGNSEYLSHADNADLGTGDIDFTFSLWIRPESITEFPVVLSKGTSVGANREFALFVDTSDGNRLVWQVGAFQANHIATTVAGISAGNWYHVVVWHDAASNQIGIAVNAGTPATMGDGDGTIRQAADLQIGASTDQSLYWDGLIDEVGFWKRVLTTGERTQLYNGGAGLAYSAFGGAPAIIIISEF